MAVRALEGDQLPSTGLPFSVAVVTGGLLFISGQASVDPQGNIVSGSFEDEMRRSFQNLRMVLEAAGLGWSDLVRVTSYVRDEEDLPEYNRIYAEILSAPYPARTTLTGCLPSTLRFEVDATASMGGAELSQ